MHYRKMENPVPATSYVPTLCRAHAVPPTIPSSRNLTLRHLAFETLGSSPMFHPTWAHDQSLHLHSFQPAFSTSMRAPKEPKAIGTRS